MKGKQLLLKTMQFSKNKRKRIFRNCFKDYDDYQKYTVYSGLNPETLNHLIYLKLHHIIEQANVKHKARGTELDRQRFQSGPLERFGKSKGVHRF